MDTYERTYSSALLPGQPSETADDYAIAVAVAESLADDPSAPPLPPEPPTAPPLPRADTSLDEALAMQLHEHEVERLVHPRHAKRARRRERALQAVLGGLGLARQRVIPRTNPCIQALSPDHVSADRARLLLRLDMWALQERPVVGDGACQFRAIADQLFGRQELHGEVRARVVAQLRAAPELYRDYVPDADYASYVRAAAKPGTWGDHVTLQAAADAFGVRILVVTSFLQASVISLAPLRARRAPPERTLYLAFWAEVHYNSLAPKEPGSPGASDGGGGGSGSSSSDDSSGGGARKLLGSKKLRRAADAVLHLG
ncbi:OTU9 [Scenedesmus sp. PABB004]|nr:OTU9 [Scenedesmus sp. PABB004]